MFLLEHDAKELLAAHGIAVARGILVERQDLDANRLPPPPWVVKAQLPVGGRGKAGLIRRAATLAEAQAQLRRILGARHRGHTVAACRVESAVADAAETYVSLALDPVAGGIHVMAAAAGGVDIETLAASPGVLHSAIADPDAAGVAVCAEQLVADFAPHLARAVRDAIVRLGDAFLGGELQLAEVNPLFVRPDGGWLAGDAKIVTDDNALERQPAQRALLEARAAAYPAARRKQLHGCDYVIVDPDGEIGLLTTGAGLSMMLIDELRDAGLKPYNFLDVRTGGLRGDATRLIEVLRWIEQGPRVRVLLVNIFAGITDLGEFSKLLLDALRIAATRLPVVARLVGTNLEAARDVLGAAAVAVETDLDAALARVRNALAQKTA